MKFRFLITVIALITYGLLFLFFGVFSYATDTPDSSGFPLAYKIEGCGFGCPSTETGQPGKLYGFYPISLMVDVVFVIILLFSAYKIGSRFEASTFRSKLLVSIIFVIGIFVVTFLLMLLNIYLPEPKIVPR